MRKGLHAVSSPLRKSFWVILMIQLYFSGTLSAEIKEPERDDYHFRHVAPERKISGTITDAAGNPLVGVSVQLKGTNLGTATNDAGYYEIEVETTAEAVLVFSYIGYQTQEIALANRSTFDIVLIGSEGGLDDVVVIGYGQTTKRDNTSAVSVLDMKNVAPIPVPSINDAVAGRVPGVFVTADNGAPGAKSSISIRGGATPLFVIDNVLRTQNDFENLNPNDIESYTVLKDAAATSLYGAQGGNGVILVTTKKGKEGSVNLNYSFNNILSQPTVMAKNMSAYEHHFERNKVFLDEGLPQPTSDSLLNTYRNIPGPNLREYALKTFAPEQRHDLSLSVGSRRLTYYGSLSYYDQGSILKTNRNYNKRVTYRMNTESNFDEIRLKVTTGIDGYVESNSVPLSASALNMIQLIGHIVNRILSEPIYNEFGLPASGIVGEMSDDAGYTRDRARAFNSNLALDWASPIRGLSFKVKGNYYMRDNKGKIWNRSATVYERYSMLPIPTPSPNLRATSSESSILTLQGFLSYDRTFGDHKIGFTGGYEQAQSYGSTLSAERRQYQILYDQFFIGPTLNQLANGDESESARAGYLGRLTYNYGSKYFLDATMRYDGSDLFPKDKRWGTFYALSGGWVLSEEKFMRSLKDSRIVDYLKLRGSYGVTGTVSGIGRFIYMPGYNINANAYVIDGVPVQGSSEGRLPSTDYSWYSINSRNLGLDFYTLNNRLSAAVDYFYMRTSGYVQPDQRYAAILGQSLPSINSTAARRREGYEFNLSWKDNVRDFSYQIGLNVSHYNQLWEVYPGEDETSQKNPLTRQSGMDDTYLSRGYVNDGYYMHNSDLLTGARNINALNIHAGDIKYKDVNGDGKIDEDDMRRIGSNTFPHLNYGLTMDFGYKGFYLSAVLMGSGDRDRYLAGILTGSSIQADLVYEFQKDYWTPENPNALYPRKVTNPLINGNNNFVTSDFWILKSRYIRLKYAQFGYDFKYKLLKHSSIKQLKVFVSGSNLLTSSRSLDYFIDPESNPGLSDYPIQRTISLGVNVGL